MRSASNDCERWAQRTGTNDLTFIVQISQTIQNVFHQAQGRSEREPWVGGLTLQTRKAVAERIRDEANVLANETLECEPVQEMDDTFRLVME